MTHFYKQQQLETCQHICILISTLFVLTIVIVVLFFLSLYHFIANKDFHKLHNYNNKILQQVLLYT